MIYIWKNTMEFVMPVHVLKVPFELHNITKGLNILFKLLDTQSFEIRLFESFIPRVEAWCICGLSKKQGELLSELMSSISPSLQGK